MRRLLVLLLLTWSAPLALAGPGPDTLRPYSAFELLDIDNQRNEKGQKLPDEYIPRLNEALLYSVVNLHLFHRVADHVDSAVPESKPERVVLMKVKIVGYSGAQNNATVKALVTFTGKDDNKELFQQKVNARLYYDQGAMTSALRKLARSIADLVQENW